MEEQPAMTTVMEFALKKGLAIPPIAVTPRYVISDRNCLINVTDV
jgi:hypothetical protein